MKKPIVFIPNPVLTTPAKKVARFDKKLQILVTDMTQTLLAAKNPRGVGLAAPQIGEPWQVFLIKPTEKSPVRTFINPVIVKSSDKHTDTDKDQDKKLEGCLSIPLIWGKVKRSQSVTLSYQDIHGETHEEIFNGFPAVIIQHETDHLNGTLFTHRVVEQHGVLYESVKEKNGKEVLEEITIG
jgi:peptide deformylase